MAQACFQTLMRRIYHRLLLKDYTWNGSKGFLNRKRGAGPARFRTVIQIVPVRPESR
jgi:hypothetical protein